jgi:DNA (cytosine-5)-methyltransferase 1
MQKKVKVVSLFSGCGGGDLGLIGGFDFLGRKYEKLPYEIVWANDIEHAAVETYKKHLGNHIIEKDIRLVKSESIPEHDLLIGGFPCQTFSIVGERKGLDDPRGLLYSQMVRILKDKQPKVFIAENVKGLVNISDGKIFAKMLRDFERANYEISWSILNASHFGVPQKRERVVVIGVRKDIGLKFVFPKIEPKIVPLRAVLEKDADIDPKYYFSKRAIAGMKKANKAFNKGRIQDLNAPCNTISTHLAKVSLNGTDPVLLVGKNAYRRFTPKEAARIQSFPENFDFVGSQGKQYIQIGNAIPPVLMWNVAKEILSQIINGGRFYKKEEKRDNVSHKGEEYFNRAKSVSTFAS